MSEVARQFRPETELARSVDAFWFHKSAAPERRGKPTIVYPDGCIDLIFSARRKDGDLIDARLFVAGASVTAYPVTIAEGESFVGVRFRPGMSRMFVDADPVALLGRDVRASEVDPAFAMLETQLADTATPEESLAVLRRAAVASARARTAWIAPARAQTAIALLGTLHADLRVEAVANAVGASIRSVRRDVIAWTGLSPRRLSRIFRFQAALAMVQSRPHASLTTIAYEAGYADHPHMTREFRTLAGMTPSALQAGV